MIRRSLSILFALAVTLPLACAQVPTIGIWEFDETSGLVAADSGPAGNHGQLMNFTSSPAQWIAGMQGNAISFDGVDDYVEFAPVGGLPFYTGFGASFSICMWVNGLATADDRVLCLGSSTSDTPLWSLGTGSSSLGNMDKLRVYARSAEGTSSAFYSNSTVFDSTWHHIAYVETSGKARLFVDGVQDTAVFDDLINTRGPRSPLHGTYPFDKIALGAVLRPSTCCYYNGFVDALRIFGCELDQNDVVTVMNGGLPATCRASLGEYGPGCGPGPFELFAAGSPQLGGPGLLFVMRGGHPGASASLCLDIGSIVPLDLSPLGFPGCSLYLANPTCIPVGALSAYGSSLSGVPIPMPNVPAFIGMQINFQASGFSVMGLDLSNAVIARLAY